MQDRKGLLLKMLVVGSFIAMVAVNALANILSINGVSTGAVSDSYPNLFAPVGLTFSIWGIIYLLLFAHTLYQLGLFRGTGEKPNSILMRRVGIVFSVSSLVNVAWIFSWHYRVIPLSMVLMTILLICMIVINMATNSYNLSLRDRLLIRLPFSVYFAWTTVATIANATVLLVSAGWNRFGLSEATWTIIIVAIGALIGVATLLRFMDVAYGLVFVWAYVGILIKHVAASGFSRQYPGVIAAVSACLVLIVATIISVVIQRKGARETV